ncbi:MAG: hypothetical protein ACM30G_04205 [Micromonosporaceae bacterium]
MSDSRCRGVVPAQEHSCCGGQRGHVADLGHEHRSQHGTGTGDGLNRREPGVALKLGADALGHDVDLEGERVDGPAKRDHPGLIGPIQAEPAEQLLPADTEQVRHRHPHAVLGQHRNAVPVASLKTR